MQLLDHLAIRKIEQRLAAAQISNESLSVDLIDHICCMIEERLDHGVSLAMAEEEVFKEMGEVQLKSIELETKRLTQNKYLMKKRTKIVGITALLVTMTGFTFKMLHLPGAGVLWGSGILLGAFGFLLMVLFDRFSYVKDRGQRLTTIIGYVGASALLLGFGFKLLHWPVSTHLGVAGGLLLLIYFILSTSQTKVNDSAG